jgi:ComEC/Rec2-related protein
MNTEPSNSVRFSSFAPDFILTILFAHRIFSGNAANPNIAATILLALAVAGIVVFRVRRKSALAIVLAISGLLTGAVSGRIVGRDAASIPEARGIAVEMERTITGFPEVMEIENGETVYSVRSGRLSIVSPFAKDLYPTERVVLRGKLYSYSIRGRVGGTIYLNEFMDDGVDKLAELGISLPHENLSAVEVLSSGFEPMKLLARIRVRFAERLLSSGDPRLRGLYAAFALGNRNLMSYRESQSFREAGLAHLLAISGMHVALVSAGIVFLLKRLAGERIAYGTAAVVVVAYTLLAGLPASLVRAAAMFVIYDALRAAGRKPDFIEILVVTGIATILLYPPVVDQAGFWLSYAATAGVIVFTRPIAEVLKAQGAAGMALSGTLAANAAILPMSFYFFRSVNILFPLSNLAAAMLFTPLSYLVFLRIVATAAGLTVVEGAFDPVVKFLWDWTVSIADYFSRASWSFARLEAFGPAALAVGYIALAACLILPPIFIERESSGVRGGSWQRLKR